MPNIQKRKRHPHGVKAGLTYQGAGWKVDRRQLVQNKFVKKCKDHNYRLLSLSVMLIYI